MYAHPRPSLILILIPSNQSLSLSMLCYRCCCFFLQWLRAPSFTPLSPLLLPSCQNWPRASTTTASHTQNESFFTLNKYIHTHTYVPTSFLNHVCLPSFLPLRAELSAPVPLLPPRFLAANFLSLYPKISCLRPFFKCCCSPPSTLLLLFLLLPRPLPPHKSPPLPLLLPPTPPSLPLPPPRPPSLPPSAGTGPPPP